MAEFNVNVINLKECSKEMDFVLDEKLNSSICVGIATACENQCVHTNVSSTKLGRTRS